MGSHQPQEAVPVQDEKLDSFGFSELYFVKNQNDLAFNPSADGSPEVFKRTCLRRVVDRV